MEDIFCAITSKRCVNHNCYDCKIYKQNKEDFHRKPALSAGDWDKDSKAPHSAFGLDFVKADSGKLQWSLMPFKELEDVVKVLMLGAKKYSPDNWKKCDDVKRYKDALMRHVISYVSGDEQDKESGLSHLAHAVCNCLFLMYFDKQKGEKDVNN